MRQKIAALSGFPEGVFFEIIIAIDLKKSLFISTFNSKL